MVRTPVFVWIGLLLALTRLQADGQGRRVESLDRSWRFMRGEAQGATAADFDDCAWRVLNVPHDWSIEGLFQQDSPSGQGGAFLPTGIGWYRKPFSLAAADRLRRVWVEFDGVMANSEVWINGFPLGKRPNGYVGFRYELTGRLHFGPDRLNLLAVRADNSAQPASRWYAGAGIYRHVRLIVTDPVSIPSNSLSVTTPRLTDAEADARVRSTVENGSAVMKSLALRIDLFDPAGHLQQTEQTHAHAVASGKTWEFAREIRVTNPERWSVDSPHLYRVVVTVMKGSTALDSESATFGMRDAHFEAATGFWLNGKNLKIKGVCLHQEAGGLGMAVPRSVWERKVICLKALGVNAIRAAHTPFSPDFLNMCDRLGMLVMDELFDCWTVGKTPYDYHLVFKEWAARDARDTVMRDRNHPSIILYSIGNEIHDTPNAALAHGILISLRDVVHAADPTRPVTQALFRPNASHDYANGLADLLDVIGQNYREVELLAAHREKPERKILGTENGQDRRVWLALRDSPAYAGQFLWTGIDYLGEAKRWPAISADFGLFDRTLTPRPRAHERRSWWAETPMVAIARRVAANPLPPTDPGYDTVQPHGPTLFSDWTPRSAVPHEESIEVYTNCEQVELFLNGKSLGSQLRKPDASPLVWKVAFAPGVLRASGRNEAQEVATASLQTAGKPARIMLTSDRARLSSDWEEVAFVTVQIVDKDGVLIPDAQDKISFSMTGPGVIAAVDNGDLISHESFQSAERRLYRGRCLAIVRAVGNGGPITLTASAIGYPSTNLLIETTAPGTTRRP